MSQNINNNTLYLINFDIKQICEDYSYYNKFLEELSKTFIDIKKSFIYDYFIGMTMGKPKKIDDDETINHYIDITILNILELLINQEKKYNKKIKISNKTQVKLLLY